MADGQTGIPKPSPQHVDGLLGLPNQPESDSPDPDCAGKGVEEPGRDHQTQLEVLGHEVDELVIRKAWQSQGKVQEVGIGSWQGEA